MKKFINEINHLLKLLLSIVFAILMGLQFLAIENVANWVQEQKENAIELKNIESKKIGASNIVCGKLSLFKDNPKDSVKVTKGERGYESFESANKEVEYLNSIIKALEKKLKEEKSKSYKGYRLFNFDKFSESNSSKNIEKRLTELSLQIEGEGSLGLIKNVFDRNENGHLINGQITADGLEGILVSMWYEIYPKNCN